MSEWKTYRLSEVGKIITGKTPPTADADNFSNIYPFITPRDMVGQKNIFRTERYLSEKGKELLKNNLLPPKSVCVSCIGSDLGKVVMTTQNSFTNQQINSIVCNDNFDSEFIYYASLLISASIRNIGKSSTAVPIVNKSQFSDFEIEAPEKIEEQHQIASILSSLDDKIELNLQMNQTLEAMAQAIFKEWFVNFNFPGFDGELVDGLPKGWKIGKLGDFFDFVKGVSYRSAELMESKLALVTLKSMNRFGGLNYNGFKEFNGKYKESQELKVGDVVIAQTDITQAADVIGCPAIVENPFNYEKLIASIDLVKCVQKTESFSSLTLFYFLSQKSFKDYCLSHTNGSTVLHLRSSEIPKYEFIVPDVNTLIEFDKIISSIRDKIILNNNQNQMLANTRDSLLPKLMTGKIEIQA